jgi:hypothetical protein
MGKLAYRQARVGAMSRSLVLIERQVRGAIAMSRRRLTLLLSTSVLALSMAGAFASPPPARAATDLKICGTVTAYQRATALADGLLVVGAAPLVVAESTSLSSKVAVGANLCFALDLNASGSIVGAKVTANATGSLRVCGVITELARAGAETSGRLVINGVRYLLAIGSSLPANVKAGANLCLKLMLNGFGQVTGGSVSANATTTLRLCGVVTGLARATSTSTGLLEVAGRRLTLAIGSRLPAAITVGADLCLRLRLNALGQVQDGTAEVDVQTTATVCGEVTARVDATGTSDGSLTIGGIRHVLRSGTDLSSQVRAGAFVRLRLSVDAFGAVTDGTVLKVGASLAEACGPPVAPSPKPSPSGSDSGGPSASPSPAAVPSGGDASPSPSSSVEPAIAGNPGAGGRPGNGVQGAGAGGDGLIPNTASLMRTASVIVAAAVPLLILLGATGVALLVQRRRRESAGRAEVSM